MKINFTQIFQDSWNFMRNQRSFFIVFCLCFFLVNAIAQFLLGTSFDNLAQQGQSTTILADENLNQVASLIMQPKVLFISFASEILNALLATWALVVIHQINQQSQFNLGQTVAISLKYFMGMVFINFLIIFPLLYGLSSLLLGGGLGLVLTLVGGYLFLRLCLAPLVYLFEHKGFFPSIQYSWQKSHKKLALLAIYCLINYLGYFVISNQLPIFSQQLLLQTVALALMSVIRGFLLIFSYRFYHLFIRL